MFKNCHNFGKTESELLKLKTMIRKFIFMPLTNKNIWQELLKATVVLPFKDHIVITLHTSNTSKIKWSTAWRKTNEKE